MTPPQPMGRVLRLLAAGLLVAGCAPGGDDEPLLVAAAADLRPAFTEIGADFEAATGERVVFNFGSSGQLAQQLIEGAPMDLYASADASFVDRVVTAGVGDPATRRTYAIGRIAIWSRTDSWHGWQQLSAVAADPRVTTIAIANPEHAPYGRAARQALEATGVWNELSPRLVYGENIADTQRLAATGDADVAIVALSLALAADEAGDGRWTLVDGDLHDELRQDLIVTTDDVGRAALALRFIDHLASEEGRRVMQRYGFLGEHEPAPSTGDG